MIKKSMVLLILIMICTVPNVVFAHTSGSVGGESSGWSLDIDNHNGSASFKYKFDSSVDDEHKEYIRTGATRWSSKVTITESSTGYKGTINQYSDENTSTEAAFYNYISSSGHLTSWKIKLNRPLMSCVSPAKREGIATHELGHAIGLNDLYNSTNDNKLMYGYSSRTTNSPATADLTGASEGIK
ncbi:hypothetical protein [Cohnella panacarvi]|uniref:hypothetical protein n=1 Tax=Cohnella panacarvi TaxID=400776 RepID=UPI0012EBD023|nr:hypothetical protein [Cohnella panacarvi]